MDKIEFCENTSPPENGEIWLRIKYCVKLNGNMLSDIFGGYEYIMAEMLYKQFKDKAFRIMENGADEVTILGCPACNGLGCWNDLRVQIIEEENVITWKNFYNPRRIRDKDDSWYYTGFIFKFDKDEYWREIEKLKDFFYNNGDIMKVWDEHYEEQEKWAKWAKWNEMTEFNMKTTAEYNAERLKYFITGDRE